MCLFSPSWRASLISALFYPKRSLLREEIRCSCVPCWALPSQMSPLFMSAKSWTVHCPSSPKKTNHLLQEKRTAELIEMVIYGGVLLERLFSLNALDCSATIGLIFKRGRVLLASLGGSRSCRSSPCAKIRPRRHWTMLPFQTEPENQTQQELSPTFIANSNHNVFVVQTSLDFYFFFHLVSCKFFFLFWNAAASEFRGLEAWNAGNLTGKPALKISSSDLDEYLTPWALIIFCWIVLQ